MRLFRGLRVDARMADEICAHISTHGLVRWPGQRTQSLFQIDDTAALLRKPDLRLADTRPRTADSLEMTYASGDLLGAAYYAWFHPAPNSRDTPLIMELEVAPEAVAVDGNCFLHSALSRAEHPEVRQLLGRIFGRAIVPYVERAAQTPRVTTGSTRTAIYELAVRDPKVVAAHLGSRAVIRARGGVMFRSHFLIPAVLPAPRVVRVWRADKAPPMPLPEIDIEALERRIMADEARGISHPLAAIKQPQEALPRVEFNQDIAVPAA